MSNKASQTYWDQFYDNTKATGVAQSALLRSWIKQYIPVTQTKTCIEIGCYPGGYLSVFGELGYELFGIDFVAKVHSLPDALKQKNYKTGEFWNDDFTKFDPHRKFDVVSSFGFIEHFTNWDEILTKHMALVETDGYLVVEVPNFLGDFQNWFHRHFDKEALARHHVPAMDVEKWVPILNANGFKIIFKGYFGGFDFWTENEKRSFGNRVLLQGLTKLKRPVRAVLPENRKSYSPCGGIIAVKL